MLKKICLLIIVAVATVLWSGAITADDGFYVIASRGPQGPPGAGLNPLQIATLRWYECSQNGQAFAVGNGPQGVAFDGANIWVANYGSNNVTKLRASDGATLGTFSVGTSPNGIAFDGANIWVTNYGSNNVSKLRASDGFTLGTYSVGTGPASVAFDGANIWVANPNSSNVTKLRASDGTSLGTFNVGTQSRLASPLTGPISG